MLDGSQRRYIGYNIHTAALILLLLDMFRGQETHLLVVLLEPGLDSPRTKVQAVRHDRGAEDATGLVQGFLLNDDTRGQIPAKDLNDRRALDHGHLDAKAYHHGQDKSDNKVLKQTQAFHRAVGLVKEQNDHDIQDGDGAARDKRHLGDQKVDGDGGANDFGQVRGDDGGFGEHVEEQVEPAREKRAAGLRQVEACHAAQLEGETLEQDGEEIAEEDDEEKAETIGCSRGDVGCVVAGVNLILGVSEGQEMVTKGVGTHCTRQLS